METISKKDFVEIEYTGRIKENNLVFDTTSEKVAKENKLNANSNYGPVIICIGEQQILSGLDKHIEGRESGKEYEIEIKPEDAFGRKDPKLIQLMPTAKFKQQKIQPMPGLQLNIDGVVGTIKTVSGGRTLIDFNHPLAGKELLYNVKINRKVTDENEKLLGYLKLTLGSKGSNDIKTEIIEGKAKITLKSKIPKEIQEMLNGKITSLIPAIKSAEFAVEDKKPNNLNIIKS